MNSKILNILLPIICGLTAANMYYIQPLIPKVAQFKGVSYDLVSMIYTMSLAGNAVALIFFTPMGDFINRKKMISSLYIMLFFTLIAFYLSENIYFLIVIAFFIGLGVSVIPITIAYLSTNKTSGINNIGKIMSGVLLGVLLSRFVSSSFSTIWHWNSIYIFASICMLVSFAIISLYLPDDSLEKEKSNGYINIILGTFSLLKTNPTIRLYCVNGFMVMAIFSIFWNNISIYLSDEFKLDQFSIGLFSLTGIAGASAAMFSNKALKVFRHSSALLFTGLLTCFFLMALYSEYLLLLALLTLVLDGFIQLIHVNNQVNMYKSCLGNESRAASCYMTSFVIGGAVGSKLSTYINSSYGWFGISVLCSTLCIISLFYYLPIFNKRNKSEVL